MGSGGHQSLNMVLYQEQIWQRSVPPRSLFAETWSKRLGQRNAKQRRLSSQMMVSSEELYGVHDPIKGNTLDDTWLDLRIGLAPKSDRLQMLPPN